MRIALGSDHAGFDLKSVLAKSLTDWGHETLDLGTDNATDSVDYPDFGAAVGRSVVSGECDLGVAICGKFVVSAAVTDILNLEFHNSSAYFSDTNLSTNSE